MKLTNIVFARNRPLQLEGYLESFYRFIPRENVYTYILYKEELFSDQYKEVFSKFDNCVVIRESSFNYDFLKLLTEIKTEYINFGTDDVVYFDSVNLDIVEEIFKEYKKQIFGFSLRMNPETIQEKNINKYKVKNQDIYSVNWKKTKDNTAKYPFELNGTIYKTNLVKEIISNIDNDKVFLKKVFTKDSLRVKILSNIFKMKNFLALLQTFHNPNNLEGHCYRWVKTHKNRYPDLVFFQNLCSSAIQVNIVNTAIDNPIDGGKEFTIESLNSKFKQGYRIDVDFLIQNKPNHTHIGKEYFRLKK